MEKIIVFIPMYNCEKQITRVLDQFNNDIGKYINEIIIVNNRSTDNGEKVVQEYLRSHKNFIKTTLVRNKENYGLGGSHKVALKYAEKNKYDYLIVLHGDDQGNINDILPYLQSGEYKKYDSFLGARFQKGSKLVNYSKFRTFGNNIYNLIFSIMLGKRIYDLGSGLNMYNLNSMKSEYYIKFPDNLVFNYCMVMAIQYYKQNVKFFPISWREDDQVSNVKMFNQAKKVLGLLFSYIFKKKKFMESDHRNKSEFKYECDVIYENK